MLHRTGFCNPGTGPSPAWHPAELPAFEQSRAAKSIMSHVCGKQSAASGPHAHTHTHTHMRGVLQRSPKCGEALWPLCLLPPAQALCSAGWREGDHGQHKPYGNSRLPRVADILLVASCYSPLLLRTTLPEGEYQVSTKARGPPCGPTPFCTLL